MAKAKSKANPVLGETMNREALEQIDHDGLLAYGRLQYGLPLNKSANAKEEVIDMILNAARQFKGNAQMKTVGREEKVGLKKGQVRVRVSPGPHNPNNRPIVVGLNFKMATIPVNRDIIMDEKWLTCLHDAVRTNYSMGQDDVTGQETLQWTEEHQYPYSVLDRG